MPFSRIKRVWDYCTYNKPFFIFILLVFMVLNIIEQQNENMNNYFAIFTVYFCFVFLFGYGLTITRDRINHGVRLPKILPKDVLILGFKSLIVFTVYLIFQGVLLNLICTPLGFAAFDLETILFQFPETLEMLFEHDPTSSIIFVTAGAAAFYITVFFMEIALARLADTGKLLASFNLLSIKRIIDVVGWRNYALDYTLIIIAIGILGFLKIFHTQVGVLDFIMDMILSLLIFATEFLGIGAVYAQYKDKNLENQVEWNVK